MHLRLRLALATIATAIAASLVATPAALAAPASVPAAGAGTGWLRLAHLSPDTAAVDVYLSSQTGSTKPIVLRGVGYGDVSSYMTVKTGRYLTTMRRAGSAATSATIVSQTVDVGASRAYTVAVVGLRSALAGRVLVDDLTPPPAGQARIRLVQGSTRAPAVQVQAIGGPVLAQSARFASATGYADVPAGRWNIRITPTSGSVEPLTTTLDVPAGRVSTVFVLDGLAAGTLKVNAQIDSSGAAAIPVGGVNTGYGPASRASMSSLSGAAWLSLLLTLSVALSVGSAGWLLARRPRRRDLARS